MSSASYVQTGKKPYTLSGLGLAMMMKEVLKKRAQFRFIALGLSMSPFIRDGDVLTISAIASPLCVGDVVAFISTDRTNLVVHRIVQLSSAGYCIKGDNNRRADGWIEASSILGRVVRVEHRDRQVRGGLGVERCLIAWLSYRGLLSPITRLLWGKIKRCNEIMMNKNN